MIACGKGGQDSDLQSICAYKPAKPSALSITRLTTTLVNSTPVPVIRLGAATCDGIEFRYFASATQRELVKIKVLEHRSPDRIGQHPEDVSAQTIFEANRLQETGASL